jgi:hypothetical protein
MANTPWIGLAALAARGELRRIEPTEDRPRSLLPRR